MIEFIYEHAEWPHFHWDNSRLSGRLAAVRHKQGRLLGRMEALGFHLTQEALLQTLTQDVLKSSEIEGETLDREQVRSSVARQLGMDVGGLMPIDRNVEGVVEMMLDATQRYQEALTADRLFAWHAALFPTGRSGLKRIRAGTWRDDGHGPMQVVSGPLGRQKVHFQAPDATRLEFEMTAFLDWLNGPAEIDGVLKAALAHLWFVTIHPFDDGNGRIARAIADLALARSESSPRRFYSMSAQIRQERDSYYAILEQTQKGTLDITNWMEWFLHCMERAIAGAQATLERVLRKASFWESANKLNLNQRQKLVLNKLLEDFEGNLTTAKWAKLTKTSHDTALRDIQNLLDQGLLQQSPKGGRSTNYELKVLNGRAGETNE
jgi:Fic family protein